jgi:hypothetical protein
MPHATGSGYHIPSPPPRSASKADHVEFAVEQDLVSPADVDDVTKAELLAKEGSTSAGTSSSQSETKPDKSGPTVTTGPLSPAPDAENLSDQDLSQVQPQQATQESSSASSTAGSTQETGADQQSPQDSSADADSSSKSKGKRGGAR